MTRSPSPLRTLPIAFALVTGASFWPGAATAQSAAAPAPVADAAPARDSDTIRLTDAQRREILDHNTMESAAAARGELPDSDIADRGIHGEMGFMIGTHGARGVYGAAEVPLGDHGTASIAVESEHYDFGRRR